MVILGPSGSGKTTLLRLIAGLEMPDRGKIYINGLLANRINWILSPHKRGIGFVFQSPALWPHMTVAQNILFGLQNLTRSDAHKQLMYLLERASLKNLTKRYPDELSGGEARRVSILRSLAPRPQVLLMDEPLIHMDEELSQDMLSFIQDEVSKSGASLLYVTHNPREAKQISGRMFYLRKGRLEKDSQKKNFHGK
jgi:ABC-type Fe3+/spermidine/putrescine transport system ATPase subunit